MTDFPVIIEKMALVNVDLQNCFVENSPFPGMAFASWYQIRVSRVDREYAWEAP